MQKYTDTVIKDGKPISGLVVTVANHPAGTPATIYAATGAAVTSVQTDGSGRFEFYAPNGHYSLTVSGAGINPYTLNDIVLFDPLDGGAAGVSVAGGSNVQAALGSKAPLASPTFMGNVCQGESPLAWSSAFSVHQFIGGAALASAYDSAYLIGNAYYNAGGNPVRRNTAQAGQYGIEVGAHIWRIAAYGAAGTSLAWTEAARIDTNGNLLVGTATGSNHSVRKNVTSGGLIFGIGPVAGESHRFYAADAGGASSAITVYALDKMASTGRSINAAGTVNASGADYAEYMTKAPACSAIVKGSIVGVNAVGQLVDKWADAFSFRVKSTDPSYVGGDVWGSEEAIGAARPQEPQFVAPSYEGVAHPGNAPAEGATDDERLAYAIALSQFNEAQQAHAAVVGAAQQQFDTVVMRAYAAALADFEQKLEAARQKVDRIAFCGQVPVNVLGAAPGQYVVPVQDGEGIGAQLVNKSSMTLAQYLSAVGRVQNILPDGRANVVVKVI
jgi:hypothetical protein